MISKKTKYALKALASLAEQKRDSDHPMLIAELASQERIPRKFLELILLELKNHGILKSRMGKGGGYFLARDAASINMLSVIRIFEGPLAPLPCLSKTAYEKCEECDSEHACGIRAIFKNVHEATLKILGATTLQDMVDKAKVTEGVPMYDI